MAIQARENMEINGGDDVDDDIPPEPRPTRRDVLKAASTINKYVQDSNDPLARKNQDGGNSGLIQQTTPPR